MQTDSQQWKDLKGEIWKQTGLGDYFRLRSFYRKGRIKHHRPEIDTSNAFHSLPLELRLRFLEHLTDNMHYCVFNMERGTRLSIDELTLMAETAPNDTLTSYALAALVHKKTEGKNKEPSFGRKENLALLTQDTLQRRYAYHPSCKIHDGLSYWDTSDNLKPFRMEAYETIKQTLTQEEIEKIMANNRDREMLLDLLDDERITRSAIIEAAANKNYPEVFDRAFDLIDADFTTEEARILMDKKTVSGRLFEHPNTPRDVLYHYAKEGRWHAFRRIEHDLTADELDELAKKCVLYTVERAKIRRHVFTHENTRPETAAHLFCTSMDFKTLNTIVGYNEYTEVGYTGKFYEMKDPIYGNDHGDDDFEFTAGLLKDRNFVYKTAFISEVKRLEGETIANRLADRF